VNIEVKVPVFPESVNDGTVVSWHKKPGEPVQRDEVLADVETDKVVFEIPAPDNGVLLDIVIDEGTTVTSQQVLAHLDTSDAAKAKAAASTAAAAPAAPVATPATTATPAVAASSSNAMPAAAKMMAEKGVDAAAVPGTGRGGRILKEDVQKHLTQGTSAGTPTIPTITAVPGSRLEKRVAMTRLRARIAERLLEAQHNAAILTTFNEINMKPVMDLRSKYKDLFEKKHGVKLGFMSFFVKACIEALKDFPEVNASVDGSDIVYHGFFDIGIAVGSPRGLVVPILRDADQMTVAQIESQIADFGKRAKEGKLGMEEITGGTFSVTNGGVFGSLLSTPILNPPQSAILGMHKIQERPVVEDGEIVVRPMMYVALSYDHRIVDGREAVQFLVTIKNVMEDPARLLLNL